MANRLAAYEEKPRCPFKAAGKRRCNRLATHMLRSPDGKLAYWCERHFEFINQASPLRAELAASFNESATTEAMRPSPSTADRLAAYDDRPRCPFKAAGKPMCNRLATHRFRSRDGKLSYWCEGHFEFINQPAQPEAGMAASVSGSPTTVARHPNPSTAERQGEEKPMLPIYTPQPARERTEEIQDGLPIAERLRRCLAYPDDLEVVSVSAREVAEAADYIERLEGELSHARKYGYITQEDWAALEDLNCAAVQEAAGGDDK